MKPISLIQSDLRWLCHAVPVEREDRNPIVSSDRDRTRRICDLLAVLQHTTVHVSWQAYVDPHM